MKEGDVITSTHRGHGHAIAFGLDLDQMSSELLGKASGYCHGKGRFHARRRRGGRDARCQRHRRR